MIVDIVSENKPWSNVMSLLQEHESSDSELLVYAVTLINKTLHGLSDQDAFYDQIEHLESLGMQQIVNRCGLTAKLAFFFLGRLM